MDLFEKWDQNSDKKISWFEFREGLNNWEWKLDDPQTMQQKIDEYYHQVLIIY